MSRTCPDCGVALDADEQFCGSCGCYVEWSAQPAAGPALAEAPPASPAPPPPPSPPPPARSPSSSAPPPPPPPGSPQQPAARQPGSGTPRVPPRRADVAPEPLQPGDLVCGTCGTGNKPTRRFCRRCGDDLATAEVAHVPWWRRVLRRRGPSTRAAGDRPTSRRRPRLPRAPVVLLVLVAVLAVGGYALRDTLRRGLDVVLDRVQGVERVVPDEVTASSAAPGHPARLASDGASNKYWAPDADGEGRGEFLDFTFAEPVRLVNVQVTPGVSPSDEEAFRREGRPAVLRVRTTDTDGEHETTTLELEDKRGATEYTVRDSDVVEVRVEIRSAFRGTAPRSRTAIGEVEFSVRR